VVETAVSAGRSRGKLVAIWVLLLVLGGIIVAVEFADRSADRTDMAFEAQGGDRSSKVVTVPMEQIGAFEVAHAGALHRFERDAAGIWFYHGAHAPASATHGHPVDPVIAERIAKAFTGLSRAKFEREFPFDPKSQDYGVLNPKMLLLIYRTGELQPLAQYAFGDMAPDGVSRYVLKIGATKVDTLPDFHEKNLIGLVQAMTAPAVGGADSTMSGVRSITGGAGEVPGPTK